MMFILYIILHKMCDELENYVKSNFILNFILLCGKIAVWFHIQLGLEAIRMNKDYYQVLGIPRTATSDEIKKAYRKLAKQYHPDVNKATDAEAKFKEINEANEVLSDPNKRRQFDSYGSNPQGYSQGNSRGYQSNAQYQSMDDLFQEIFRASQAQRQAQYQRQQQNQQGPTYTYQRKVSVFSLIIRLLIFIFILNVWFSFLGLFF